MHGAKHRTLVEVRRDDKGEGGVVALRARLLAAAAPSAAPAPATASAPACASAPASASASASATAPAAAAPAAPAASPTAAFPAARRRCEAQGIVGKHLWDMSRTCPGRVLDVSVAARRRRTSATTPRRPPHATWSRGCSSERKRVPLPSNVRPSSGERRTSPLRAGGHGWHSEAVICDTARRGGRRRRAGRASEGTVSCVAERGNCLGTVSPSTCPAGARPAAARPGLRRTSRQRSGRTTCASTRPPSGSGCPAGPAPSSPQTGRGTGWRAARRQRGRASPRAAPCRCCATRSRGRRPRAPGRCTSRPGS